MSVSVSVCVCVCVCDAVIRSSTNCYTSTRSATAKGTKAHAVSLLRAVHASELTNPLCAQFRCKMCRGYFCGAHKDRAHHGCISLEVHYDGFYSPPSSPNSVRDVFWDGGSHGSTPGSRRADELDGGSHAGTPSSRVSHDQDAAYDDCISGERSGEE